MNIRNFVLVYISLVASLALGSTVPSSQEAPLFPTRNTFFTIPFEIKVDDSSELPAEVELTYSNDQGMNWFPYGRVRPENKQFLFKSSADGEYWFIFKTYGQDGHVKETRRRGPMLRVLVDTVPPKLTLAAEQKSTGEVLIQWSVEDANLARKTPQLQISYSIPDQKNQYLNNWKPVAVDPMRVQSEGNKHQGELVIWPDHGAVAFELQAEIVDRAGNREMQSRTVSLATTTKEEEAKDANVLTESMQAAFPPIPKAVPNPAYASAEPLTPPRPPVQSAQLRPLPPSRPIPGQIANLTQINESLKSVNSAQPVRPGALDFNNLTFGPTSTEQVAELPVAQTTGQDSVLVGPPILFLEDIVGDGVLAVGSPQTPISLDSGEAFEFSLEKRVAVEVDDEVDDGPILSTPFPRYSPPDLNFDDYQLALDEEQGKEEIATEEPTPPADIALEIADRLNAFIRITKISHLRDLKLSQLLVKWETEENSWTGSEEVKIHIFRGPSQKGPWTPIAVDQKNTGAYAWDISQDDRNPFYVLLQCEGKTGENYTELVSDFTMQPIQLPIALFK